MDLHFWCDLNTEDSINVEFHVDVTHPFKFVDSYLLLLLQSHIMFLYQETQVSLCCFFILAVTVRHTVGTCAYKGLFLYQWDETSNREYVDSLCSLTFFMRQKL
ncbi:hypothetical protein ACJX0J_019515, partial [Zea mays]